MLGKLARWLRILGYDTVYDKTGIPANLYANSLNSNRLFLTRSTVFTGKTNAIILPGNTVVENLSYLRNHHNLNTELDVSKTRCALCNGNVIFISDPSDLPDEFKLSHPKVVEKHSEFTRCEDCDRIFWVGSHFEAIRRTLLAVNE